MIYKKKHLSLPLIALFFTLITSFKPWNDEKSEVRVLIVTDHGTIKVKLYNETPLHRDNFIKLARGHYYDSILFHRVIQNFMIQAGDPDSKNAGSDAFLGEGGPGYTIPAEFNPRIFHKKGALAAARESDLDNPSQASSGSQFYIVQGRVFTDTLLKVQAKRIAKMKLFNQVINREENKSLLEKYKMYVKAEMPDSIKYINDIINRQVDKELPGIPTHNFTDEQVKAYTTIGGTPHLDGSYTVFGEVEEGMEVVEEIASQKTDRAARPIIDIRIIKMSVIE